MWPTHLLRLLEKSHRSMLSAEAIGRATASTLLHDMFDLQPVLPVYIRTATDIVQPSATQWQRWILGNLPSAFQSSDEKAPAESKNTSADFSCPESSVLPGPTHHFCPCTSGPTRYTGLTSEWNHSHHSPFPKSCLLQLSSKK